MTDEAWLTLRRTPASDATLAAWAHVADTEEDPVRALRAKASEIVDARRLQRQQHAVVAGTELLGLRERCPTTLPPQLEIARGYVGASMAAMDLPEVPLAAVDQLVDATEGAYRSMGREPYAAFVLRARLHSIAAEWDGVRSQMDRVVPHLSRSNHLVHFWECPGCVLGELVQYLDAPGPEVVEQVLAPILEEGPVPWREDARYAALVKQAYGTDATCPNSREHGHVLSALACLRAGEVAKARAHWHRAARWGSRAGVWSRLCGLLLALEGGDRAEVDAALEPVLTALPRHEDVDEALNWATAAHRALRERQDPRAEGVLRQARALAARLDARLATPRHLAHLPR